MELPTLRNAWLEAKAAEEAANARRLEIEAQILEHFTPPQTGEGTVTNKAEGVSVAYKINRTVMNSDGLLAEVPRDRHDTIPHYIKASVVTPEDWRKVKE
jgi:hypothetical protein